MIMLEGTPNQKFAKQIMTRGIPEEKRNESLTWEQFHHYYDKALRSWVEDLEKSKDALRRFTTAPESRKFKPPIDWKRRDKDTVVNNMTDGYDDDDEPWETEQYRRKRDDPEVTGSEEHDFDTAYEEDAHEDDEYGDRGQQAKHSLNEVNAALGDDSWLFGIEGKTGKKVCWKFAETGKCDWEEKKGKCVFSHNPEDVEMWKAAKLLGKSRVKVSPVKSGTVPATAPHSAPATKDSKVKDIRRHSEPSGLQSIVSSKPSRLRRG